jgi:ABC-2 type transport system ATP-binding protein
LRGKALYFPFIKELTIISTISTRAHRDIFPHHFLYSHLLRQNNLVNCVEVRGLTKSYGSDQASSKLAVAGIDFEIKTGEIFALLGPNGAGKTTTVEILEGYRKRSSGEVSVLGFDPENLRKESRIWRNKIGIVLQNTKDGQELTVEEIINNFAGYYDNPRNPEEVIEAVGLTEKKTSRLEKLSGGQRRRVDVALGILGNPELLFLDEPTTGFDPEARRQFWELIQNLKNEGRTILLTTHYLDEAEVLADRVGVIANGKIIEISTPDKLGGRDQALPTVSWVENGEHKKEKVQSPTDFIIALSNRIGGEIENLSVIRPSLEDIYLEMIGENHE